LAEYITQPGNYASSIIVSQRGIFERGWGTPSGVPQESCLLVLDRRLAKVLLLHLPPRDIDRRDFAVRAGAGTGCLFQSFKLTVLVAKRCIVKVAAVRLWPYLHLFPWQWVPPPKISAQPPSIYAGSMGRLRLARNSVEKSILFLTVLHRSAKFCTAPPLTRFHVEMTLSVAGMDPKGNILSGKLSGPQLAWRPARDRFVPHGPSRFHDMPVSDSDQDERETKFHRISGWS